MRNPGKFLVGAGVAGVGAVATSTLMTKKDGFAGFVSLLLWTIAAPIYDVCFLDAALKGMNGIMLWAGILAAVIVNGVFLYLVARYMLKLVKFMKSIVVKTLDLFKHLEN